MIEFKDLTENTATHLRTIRHKASGKFDALYHLDPPFQGHEHVLLRTVDRASRKTVVLPADASGKKSGPALRKLLEKDILTYLTLAHEEPLRHIGYYNLTYNLNGWES